MKICPITYNEIPDGSKYHTQGLKMLSPALEELLDFPYSAEKQREEAVARAGKISIQGVQPKLSVHLNVRQKKFEVVNRDGRFIIKPQSGIFKELPENEDLTMKLAASAGIDVPLHGLVYCSDGSFSFFIKRFDRITKKRKLQVEDFAQLAGRTRDTKYDYSMEKTISILDRFTTFPAIEKAKLFRRTLFSFLTGNEDMHLKNFSIITRNGKQELSPAYDLVNSTLAMKAAKEETALPINGKKRNLTKKDLIDYYGLKRLALQPKVVDNILADLSEKLSFWHELIQQSFLSAKSKEGYKQILDERAERVFF